MGSEITGGAFYRLSSFPTGHYILLERQNPSIGVSELHKFCRSIGNIYNWEMFGPVSLFTYDGRNLQMHY